ncbi:MAG: sugar transferase [Lachnospiraceae bacterium]|nr:sugar transferase [Lachnospiraceae bacterium]
MYARYIKRVLDIICAFFGLLILSPIMLIVAVLVRVKLGKPVIFIQERPGRNGKIFKLYKFRSMSDARGKDGKLLPDAERLGKFGKSLRATSIDELPELINILKGDMSVVGPRPLLVRDMVFMNDIQKKRHCVLPGLTGLAQVNGRNGVDWKKKFGYDLKYIKKITFYNDLKIIIKTVNKALIHKDGITEEGMSTATDYGDYLLALGKVSQTAYNIKQIEAEKLLINERKKLR